MSKNRFRYFLPPFTLRRQDSLHCAKTFPREKHSLISTNNNPSCSEQSDGLCQHRMYIVGKNEPRSIYGRTPFLAPQSSFLSRRSAIVELRKESDSSWDSKNKDSDDVEREDLVLCLKQK
jgi:hypothetical protein